MSKKTKVSKYNEVEHFEKTKSTINNVAKLSENVAGLSELEKFKILFENKNNIVCKFDKTDKKYYVSRPKLLQALELPTLSGKYFYPTTVYDNNNPCYSLDDVMNFVKYSVEDSDLGDFRKCSVIMWRNSHYVIDYHYPMGWKFVYSFQVSVITEIIQKTLDKYELRKEKRDIGNSEYDMKDSYGLDFRIDYFIKFGPFSVAIEVNEKKTHAKKSAITADEKKEALKCLGILFVSINEETWNITKDVHIKHINEHLECLLGFTYNIMKKSDGLKELENSMSNEMFNSCLSNSEFPFELNECLKMFNVKKNSEKYKMIMSLFESDNGNSDSDSNNDSSGSDTDDISLSDEVSENNDVNENNSDPYIKDVDFAIIDGKIYVEKFTMFQIGQLVGNNRSKEFMRLVRDLLNYVEKHSKTAYTKLIKKITDFDVKLQYKTFAYLHETNSERDAKIYKECVKILKEELDSIKNAN